MMSETPVLQQDWFETQVAVRRFAGFFPRAGSFLLVIGVLTWLGVTLVVLATRYQYYREASMICAVVVYVVAWLYFLSLLWVTHGRTGLIWNVIAPDAGINLLPWPLFVGLAFVVVHALSDAIPDLLETVLNMFIGVWLPYIASRLLTRLLEKRARTEAAQYGNHALNLNRLSFWDIFFLRIPHERA